MNNFRANSDLKNFESRIDAYRTEISESITEETKLKNQLENLAKTRHQNQKLLEAAKISKRALEDALEEDA